MNNRCPTHRPRYSHLQEPASIDLGMGGLNVRSSIDAYPEMRIKTVCVPPKKSRWQHSRQAALLAQVPSRPKSNADYFAEWDAWAEEVREDKAASKCRLEAVKRLKTWLKANQPDETLNLSRLRLTSLPKSLPPTLKSLDVESNYLSSLPEKLPATLEHLNININDFSNLPDRLPATLKHLMVRSNELTRLPANLPASLESLDISSNELTSLTENLPASLKNLFANNNRLTSLPENLPASLENLSIYNNLLTSLPERLPVTIKILIAYDNRFASLPEYLPTSLINLHVGQNRLSRLPVQLPLSLEKLWAGRNFLSSLPSHLPVTLTTLIANNNLLFRLPENLPALEEFDVSHNLIRGLPENILSMVNQDCFVNLQSNPLSQTVRAHLHATINARDYSGPIVHFPRPDIMRTMEARPLEQAVSDWVGRDKANDVEKTWNAFKNEEGSVEFSAFLDRLRDTVNSGNPIFKPAVVEWLAHLANNDSLRHATFMVSLGATETCEDRISLTFNEMKKVRVAADADSGKYDQRLPELISLARGMFRLDMLEKIARMKVNSKADLLQYVDEIEVYLAYQVKLREKLDLPLDTPDMRFFGVSWVTAHDLDKAEKSVKESEAEDFIHYLSTDWQPWQSVLKRLHRQQYETAQTKLHAAMDGDFSARLNLRLRDLGMESDPDARVQVGAQVLTEMKHEINDALTIDFLETRQLSHLSTYT